MKLLIPEDEIRAAVRRLGAEITRDFAKSDPVVVPILSGSFMFAADLIRELPFPLEVDFMKVSSYKDATAPQGPIEVHLEPGTPLRGRPVLIIEDIIDSGGTLLRIIEDMRRAGAEPVKVAVLLDKRGEKGKPVPVDYTGIKRACDFVVGYGTDYAGHYRNLRGIYVLDEPDIAAYR